MNILNRQSITFTKSDAIVPRERLAMTLLLMHNLLIHNLPLPFALNSDTISSQPVASYHHGTWWIERNTLDVIWKMNISGTEKTHRLEQQGCGSAIMGPEPEVVRINRAGMNAHQQANNFSEEPDLKVNEHRRQECIKQTDFLPCRKIVGCVNHSDYLKTEPK